MHLVKPCLGGPLYLHASKEAHDWSYRQQNENILSFNCCKEDMSRDREDVGVYLGQGDNTENLSC